MVPEVFVLPWPPSDDTSGSANILSSNAESTWKIRPTFAGCWTLVILNSRESLLLFGLLSCLCPIDEFEVSLFLRESRTRHSLLTRHKEFDEDQGTSGGRLGRPAGTHGSTEESGIMVESDSEGESDLRNIPQAPAEEDEDTRGNREQTVRDSDDALGASSERKKNEDFDGQEDKKMRFKTNYEGFNIYGWMLCLLVTRKGDKARARPTSSEPSRQVLMEEWMSSQAQGDVDDE